MGLKQNKFMVTLYTIQHFLVDFTTIFLVSAVLLGPSVGLADRSSAIITYNILAFGGQLPIGLAACLLGKNRQVAAFGCLLAALAYPTAYLFPWLSCVLAAVGNGCFHIGAGSDVLKVSMPKAGASGVFVGSGALGVWLAYRANGALVPILCPVVMLVCSVLLLFCKEVSAKPAATPQYVQTRSRPLLLLAVVLFLLTIVVRSLLGTIMKFSWQASTALSLLSVLAVVGGKMAGGYLGDRFGYGKVVAISLSVALAAFVFAFELWPAGLIAIFCFNMTMPLTLTAIAGVCGGYYGFAFGLTTFALVLGFLPIVFGAGTWFGVGTAVGLVAFSLAAMVSAYGLLTLKNGTRK